MGKFINRVVRVITPLETTHPKIDRVWETGSGSLKMDEPLKYHINMLGRVNRETGRQERYEFSGYDPEKVLQEADEFLQSLPIE